MFSCKIVVYPQLVGADPVVLVNCAGAIVVFLDHLWLGDLNNYLVRWRMTRLVQLVEALTEDVPTLSNSTQSCHKKSSIPIGPTDGNKFCLVSFLID